MGEYVNTSKYSVDDLLQEADEAVSNPNWTIATSKTPGLYKEALIPGAIAFLALHLGPLALLPGPLGLAIGYGIKL